MTKANMKPDYAKLQPLNDRVIIRPHRGPDRINGIIIPEMSKEKPDEGTVVAAGPGRWSDSGQRVPMTVKTGDRVIFSRYSASEIKFDGEELRMIFEHEIHCVIR
jgi:chaperonin GroES